MTVCSYYLRGQCKFGSLCKFEHPVQPQRSGFGNRGWDSGAQNMAATTLPFTQESMMKDMTHDADRPSWPLSSYGAAKMEPTLITGLDESSEELRWRALQAVKAGNPMEYQNYESQRIQFANQTFSNVLANIDQVFRQAESVRNSASGQTASVSAFDKASSFATSPSTSGPSAFGAATGASSAFGKPAFGQSVFGQSSFGQPAKSTSVFGQPAPPVSAFGQPQTATPSAPGPTASSAPAPASVFGQPSQQPSSVFGGAQQKPTISAFGQTSQPTSSFVRPATGFGAGTGGGGFSAFAGGGTSAFTSAAGTQQQAPAFGGAGGNSPSAFGTQTTTPGQTAPVFGQPTQPTAAFGQPAQPTSVFGAGLPPKPVSAFGQAQPASAFGQTQSSRAAPAFGQTATTTTTTQPTSVFGHPAQQQAPTASSSAFGQPQPQPTQQQSQRSGASGLPPKPTAAGAPNFKAAKAKLASRRYTPNDRHDFLLPADYADIIPEEAKKLFEAERFEVGHVPLWFPPLSLR